MRLVTFEYEGKELAGVLSEDGLNVFAFEKLQYPYSTMVEAIKGMTDADWRSLKSLCEIAKGQGIPYHEVSKCAPIPRPVQDIICLGLNYADHAEESSRYKREVFEHKGDYPAYFAKRVYEAVPDGSSIPAHEDMMNSLDYEAELAIILGKDCRNVSREDAWDYVFGFTIINDVSAREVQTNYKQWFFGKSLDGFCPMGPWIVTKDEFKFPLKLNIMSRVNGELRQNSNTERMIFDIPYVIEELSKGMTLEAGTIISTGTPAGVGMGFDPPKFLRSGDMVECEIEGIGILKNIVE